MDDRTKRLYMEGEWGWNKWKYKVPAIQFPADWRIKIIPPFDCVTVRFVAICGEESISVHLDTEHVLSHYDLCHTPYWEAQFVGGDVWRCDWDKHEELIATMEQEFENRKKEKQHE